ncbi:kinase-like protein [Obba rivulosa]|uniref:Kinase-like protein n=1 Tax=Obba rivulosa TaxID=1052685 RepID=A0A8E2ALN3_9APHY|nr:kinase-like protein [Obba rivulosa]
MEHTRGKSDLDHLRDYHEGIKSASRNFPVYKETLQQLVMVSEEYALALDANTRSISVDDTILKWFEDFYAWVQSNASANVVVVLPRSEAVKQELKGFFEKCPAVVLQHATVPLSFQPSYDEILDSLRNVMSSRESVRAWTELEGAEAQAVVELLDVILDNISMQDRLWRPCIDVTKKLCGKLKFFPVSFSLLPGSVRKLSEKAIARGGFSDVFKGLYEGKEVALKVIRPQERESTDVRHAKMFTREAVIWKRLQHPNVLPFHGIDTTLFPSQTTLVSDWMPRGHVRDYLRKNPQANRLRLILDVVEGLVYLHGLDIIHGDLKSMNILVDHQHVARIADFGLTNLNYHSQMVSRTAAEVGTVRWSAPELIDPPSSGSTIPTRQSDIYALAMVMWEMSTGMIPFHESTREATVIHRVMSAKRPLRPKASDAPDLSDELWSLIERCWGQDWQFRPDAPSVAIVVRRLQEA